MAADTVIASSKPSTRVITKRNSVPLPTRSLKKDSKLRSLLKSCSSIIKPLAVATSTVEDEADAGTTSSRKNHATPAIANDKIQLLKLQRVLNLLALPEYSQAADVISFKEQFLPVVDWLLREQNQLAQDPAYWACFRLLLNFNHDTIYPRLTEIFVLLSISYASGNGSEQIQLCLELIRTFNKLNQSNRLLKRMLESLAALRIRSDNKYLFLSSPILNEFFVHGYANVSFSVQQKLIRIMMDEIYASYKPNIQSAGNVDPSLLIRFKVLACWIWCSFAFLSVYHVSIPLAHLQAVEMMLMELNSVVKFLGLLGANEVPLLTTIYLMLLHALQTTAVAMKTHNTQSVADNSAVEDVTSETSLSHDLLTDSMDLCASIMAKPDSANKFSPNVDGDAEKLFWSNENIACLLISKKCKEDDRIVHAVVQCINNCRFAFHHDLNEATEEAESACVSSAHSLHLQFLKLPHLSAGILGTTSSRFEFDDICIMMNDPAGTNSSRCKSKQAIFQSVARVVAHYLASCREETGIFNNYEVESSLAALLFSKHNVKAWVVSQSDAARYDYTAVFQLLVAVLPLFRIFPGAMEKIIRRSLLPAAVEINCGSIADTTTCSTTSELAADTTVPLLCVCLAEQLVNLVAMPDASASDQLVDLTRHPSLYALQFICCALKNHRFRNHLLHLTTAAAGDKHRQIASLTSVCTIIVHAFENLHAFLRRHEIEAHLSAAVNNTMLNALSDTHKIIQQIKDDLFSFKHYNAHSIPDSFPTIDAVVNVLQTYDGCLHVMFYIRSIGSVLQLKREPVDDTDALMDVDEEKADVCCEYDAGFACGTLSENVENLVKRTERLAAFVGKNKDQSKRNAFGMQLCFDAQKCYDAVSMLNFLLTNENNKRQPSGQVDEAVTIVNCGIKCVPQICRVITTLQRDFLMLCGGEEEADQLTTQKFQICVIVLLRSMLMVTKLMLDSLAQKSIHTHASTADVPETVRRCCRVCEDACFFLVEFFGLHPLQITAPNDAVSTDACDAVSPALLDHFSRQNSSNKNADRRALLLRLLDEQQSIVRACENRLAQQCRREDAGQVEKTRVVLSPTVLPTLSAHIVPQLAALIGTILHLPTHVLGEHNRLYHDILGKCFIACIIPLPTTDNDEDAVRMQIALHFIYAIVPPTITSNAVAVPLDTMALFIKVHAKLITVMCELVNSAVNRKACMYSIHRISLVLVKMLQCRPRVLSQESILQTIDNVALVADYLSRTYATDSQSSSAPIATEIDAEFFQTFIVQVDCLNALLVNNTAFALKCPTPLMKSLSLLMTLLLDVSCLYRENNSFPLTFVDCAQKLQRIIRLLAQHADEYKRTSVHLIADYLLKMSYLSTVERLPLSAAALKIPPAAVRSTIRVGLCQLFRAADKRALQNMKLMLPAHLQQQFQSLYEEYTALYKFDARTQ